MAYVAGNARHYVGKSVGNGQCVAFAVQAASMPHTATWKRGELVKGNIKILPGTAIATFDANERYGNHTDGRSHAAIYLGQNANGIQALDQWMFHKHEAGIVVSVPQNVHERTIFFRSSHRTENDGRKWNGRLPPQGALKKAVDEMNGEKGSHHRRHQMCQSGVSETTHLR